MKPFDCSYKYLVVGSERACKTLDHEEFDVANPGPELVLLLLGPRLRRRLTSTKVPLSRDFD